MLTTYEHRLVLSFIADAFSHLHRGSSEAKELVDWVEENSDVLGVGSSVIEVCRERTTRRTSSGRLSKVQSRELRELLFDSGAGGSRRVRTDRLASRLRSLAREMQLSRTDVAILEIMLRYRSNPVIESLIDAVFEGGRHFRGLSKIFNVRGPALPCFLGISGSTFLRRFDSDAPLVRSGLVSVDEDGDLSVIDRLRRLASMSGSAKIGAHLLLLDAAPPGELEWSDFDHIAEARDHVEALLRGALRAGTKGVNILVHGEADSLLTDRRFAVRSWEVSQVNEMLTWMESLSILRPSAGSCSRWPSTSCGLRRSRPRFRDSSLCRRLQQVSSR